MRVDERGAFRARVTALISHSANSPGRSRSPGDTRAEFPCASRSPELGADGAEARQWRHPPEFRVHLTIGMPEVMVHLEDRPEFGRGPEPLREPERHLSADAGPRVQDRGECFARDGESVCGGADRQLERRDPPVAQHLTRMRRIVHDRRPSDTGSSRHRSRPFPSTLSPRAARAIVHLLFRASAMQMYSSPGVSDRTPNPSCCTDSRALSLGKAKAHPIVHIDEVDCLKKGYSRQSNRRRFGSPPQNGPARSEVCPSRAEAQRNRTGRQSHASEILWKAPDVHTTRPAFTRNGKALRILPPVAPKRCAFCGATSWEQVGLPEGVMHITWF